jgi:2-polyprenyl-6-methoxyphenol hydroxylase-like FAD-dependent oxidoreductase
MTRILIVGGGIAGTAAALALHKAGVDVTVFEEHPDSGSDIGAFLTLASNGMLALAQIDAARAVAGTGFPLTRMRILGDRGDEVASAPLGDHLHELSQYRCLRRAELVVALQGEARRRRIAVRHGRRLTTVTEHATGVTATFDDDSTADGDLLIGADGLNSVVRSLIDPAAAPPRYAGQRVFYGYTTEAAPPKEPRRIDMIRGSAAAFGYTVSPHGETYWFARVPGPELSPDEIAGTGPARWREQLVALLRPDATPAAGIVAATGTRLLVTNACDLPAVTRWRTGRMLIIGDAAHAASPATGQGASMALEDAVVLAKALRDAGSTEAAFHAYERLRRPRVEANIANSARMTVSSMPDQRQRTLENQRLRSTPRPSPTQDDELRRQLDWHTPLPL